MTGREIYELGSQNLIAQMQADSDLVNTTPRMSFDEARWCAEFWYFVQTLKRNGTVSLSAPRLYVAFRLPSREMLTNKRLGTPGREMLGFSLAAEEMANPKELDNYLEFCGEITSSAPDKQILAEADKLWQQTLPKVLKAWFLERDFQK